MTTSTIAPNVGTIFYGLPFAVWPPHSRRHGGDDVAKSPRGLAGIKDAVVIVINPPPVQGLGAAGGFKLMVEDRGDHTAQQLADATNALVAVANKDPISRVSSPSTMRALLRFTPTSTGKRLRKLVSPRPMFSRLFSCTWVHST